MTTTRRDFLRNVGVAGGAGVMLSTMEALHLAPSAAADTPPFSPLDKTALRGKGKRSVVVLGAGPAGLTAAYELLKGGYDVTLLEGNDRPGGRTWTVRGGDRFTDLDGHQQRAQFAKGEYMNAGAARIPQSHLTLGYCKELGVEIQPFANQNANALLYREGEHALNGESVQMRAAKADTFGYVSELLAKATDQGALDAYLTGDDKERIIALMRSMGDLGGKVDGDPDASYAYSGSSRRGYAVQPGAGTESGEQIPPFELSDVLASGVGQYFSFESGFTQAMMMYQPVGGMDTIWHAFAAAIGKRNIIYNAPVVEYRNTSNGAEVLYQQGGAAKQITADFVINALPPHIASKLRSNMPAEIVSSLSAPRVSNAGKIGIQFDRRWWEEDFRIYGGISNADNDLSNIWHPSYGFHGDKGVMIGYYNTGSNANTYGALAPPQRLKRAVDQGAKVFGDVYRRGITASFSQNWMTSPYAEGAWAYYLDKSDPEYTRLLEPTGQIYFAGDHLSHAVAWQHGAIVSARAAVTQIQERVESSS